MDSQKSTCKPTMLQTVHAFQSLQFITKNKMFLNVHLKIQNTEIEHSHTVPLDFYEMHVADLPKF